MVSRRQLGLALCLSLSAPSAGGCDREVRLGHADRAPDPRLLALAGRVDIERFETDLLALPADRTFDTDGWRETQDFCAARLTELGFDVERQSYGAGVNVIGTLPGATAARVFVTTNYESSVAFPSGVAGLMEIARVLVGARLERTLVVTCLGGRDATGDVLGLVAYVERELALEREIVAVFEVDGVAVYRDDPGAQWIPPEYELLFPVQYEAVRANQFRGDYILTFGDDESRSARERFGVYADALGLRVIDVEFPDELVDGTFGAEVRKGSDALWSRDLAAVRVDDTHDIGRLPDPNVTTLADIDYEFATRVLGATVASVAAELGPTPGD